MITAEEARTLLDGATPGPWEYRQVSVPGEWAGPPRPVHQILPDNLAIAGAGSDARLIAAAPDLAATVIATSEQLAEARAREERVRALVTVDPRLGRAVLVSEVLAALDDPEPEPQSEALDRRASDD